MPRQSSTLFKALTSVKSSYQWSSSSPPVYAIGLSYANKDSPPFVHPGKKPPRTGFAHLAQGKADHIRDWVRENQKITAGRGELESTAVGGWTDEVRDRVIQWGAGEDFYALEGLDSSISNLAVDNELSIGKSGPIHLAISDGVGGWSDKVDPSFFSQGLMYHYAKSARKSLNIAYETGLPGKEGPLDHLREAYEGVMKEGVVFAGGATACGISLDPKGTLKGVNLGDSGLSILRDGKVIYSTPASTHYFNCPKQLSKVPASMKLNGIIHDHPDKDGETFSAELQPNDVIVLYTDGLSDNVPTSHFALLLSHLNRLLDHPDNAHLGSLDRAAELARLYADVLVGYGRAAMTRTGHETEEVDGEIRPAWKTPFEIEAQKHMVKARLRGGKGGVFRGGKIDDITVITAVVSEKNPE